VRYGKQYETSFPRVYMLAAILPIDLHVFSLDDEPPTLRHGVTRVETQIHEHLLDLRGIDHGDAQIGSSHDADFDLLPDYPAQQAHSLHYQAIKIRLSRLQHLAAGKCQ